MQRRSTNPAIEESKLLLMLRTISAGGEPGVARSRALDKSFCKGQPEKLGPSRGLKETGDT